ncbi:hypothetical protein HK100_006861 [Physocladia obscura]|uniref:Agd3 CBM87 domain-containing protein n=1 Tax=Physocladia obscura TaxID=109957 RepID=A0AAD5XML3_9FUNG|nr:hypothetical protein HK100_006861 [Physocladia obscura]
MLPFLLGWTVLLVHASVFNQAVVFGSETASAEAAIIGLATFKVAYIAYNTSESIAFTILPLYDTNNQPQFSMIILGSGGILFSTGQWAQLYGYQNTNNIRLVALYDIPGLGSSSGYTSPVTTVYTGQLLTPASTKYSTDIGLPASYSLQTLNTTEFGYVYPGTILNLTAVTPVLNFTTSIGTFLGACIYNFTATQQQISFFYQIASWDLSPLNTPTSFVQSLSSYTNAIWINWVSHGAYGLPHPVTTDTSCDGGNDTVSVAGAFSAGTVQTTYYNATLGQYEVIYAVPNNGSDGETEYYISTCNNGKVVIVPVGSTNPITGNSSSGSGGINTGAKAAIVTVVVVVIVVIIIGVAVVVIRKFNLFKRKDLDDE